MSNMSIPSLIFVVPYRNRKYLKIHFDKYITYLLEDISKEDYKIYFVHQTDTRPFNRGGMKNIGFLAMKDKYPDNYKDITFVFNDIDTMPAEKNLINYKTTHGNVKHFYGFDFALGGIFSITGGDFEKCGGFPNYWAWGLEDNAMQQRVIKNKLNLDRSQFFKYMDPRFIQIPYDIKRILSKEQSWHHKHNQGTVTDITNLDYVIEDEYINVKHFNTNHDPKNEHYHHQQLTNKIHHDKNFNPYGNNFTLLQNNSVNLNPNNTNHSVKSQQIQRHMNINRQMGMNKNVGINMKFK
jgi:hypothetical protein